MKSKDQKYQEAMNRAESRMKKNPEKYKAKVEQIFNEVKKELKNEIDTWKIDKELWDWEEEEEE